MTNNHGPEGTSSPDEQLTRQMLQEIADATPRGRWEQAQFGRWLEISLPHGCEVKGLLRGDDFDVADIKVDPQLRGHRIGTRLLQASLIAAQRAGAQWVGSVVTSKEGLAIFDNIFGGGLDISTHAGQMLTPEEAQGLLEEARRQEHEWGVHVVATLQDVDTTEWEIPDIAE